jgi:hypothetical protein
MSDSTGDELRASGYRRTQRLWLTQENYDLVMYLAEQDKVMVDRIIERTRWQRRNE